MRIWGIGGSDQQVVNKELSLWPGLSYMRYSVGFMVSGAHHFHDDLVLLLGGREVDAPLEHAAPEGAGCRVQGSGFRVQGARFQRVRCRVSVVGCRVMGVGCNT